MVNPNKLSIEPFTFDFDSVQSALVVGGSAPALVMGEATKCEEPSNASTNKILSKPPPAKRQRMRSFLLTSGTTVRYPCWAAMDSDSD